MIYGGQAIPTGAIVLIKCWLNVELVSLNASFNIIKDKGYETKKPFGQSCLKSLSFSLVDSWSMSYVCYLQVNQFSSQPYDDADEDDEDICDNASDVVVNYTTR